MVVEGGWVRLECNKYDDYDVHTLGLHSYLRFEGGTGVGCQDGPVIPSEEV